MSIAAQPNINESCQGHQTVARPKGLCECGDHTQAASLQV